MKNILAVPENTVINTVDDMLDLMMNMQHQHNCNTLIIDSKQLNPAFFDLKTGFAGEMLQKFSTYRMRLGITGDFSVYRSKSLHDFIRESNKRGKIVFADTAENAKALIGAQPERLNMNNPQ
ncbi:MAG: DUF4180 domain-containing protein [Prevotellaceae bacterium]|nr:DUF4180 domain-containing protein [Prevotellaceae bacterium]